MTSEETSKILNIIFLNYPYAFKDWSASRKEAYRDMWSNAFKDIPVQLVTMSVQDIVFSTGREYAPNIGQIKQHIVEMVTDSPEADSDSAWIKMRKFVRNMSRDKKLDMEEYMQLPKPLRDIYSYGSLLEMSYQTKEENDYRESGFKKSYISRKRETDMQNLNTGNLVELMGEEKMNKLGISKTYNSIESQQIKLIK